VFLLLTLCIIITPKNSYSQACDVLTLKNDEIVFLFDGHYYRDGSTAIICESSLAEPLLTIELQKFGSPPSAIEVKWLSGTDSEDNPSTISIDHFKKQGSFLGKKYMTNNIEASIVSDKSVYTLTVKLLEDCSLHISKTRSKAAYGVDANTKKGYPTYNIDPKLNKPYKWIPKEGSDEVVLKLKPSNTSIKNHLDIHAPEDNVSAEPILDPMGNLTQHTLNHLSDTGNDFDKVHICDHYAYNLINDEPKTLEVDLYIVTETDDDFLDYCLTDPYYKADCTTPLNQRHRCINPGSDGALDLYYQLNDYANPPSSFLIDPSLGPNPIWINSTEELFTLEVRPIPTFIPSKPYVCNMKKLLIESGPSKKPVLSTAKRDQIIDDMNEVYNQVGISVDITFIDIDYNFDSVIDDDVLDEGEISQLHNWLIFQYPGIADANKVFNKTTGWIVYGDESYSVLGRATEIGLNTFCINYSNHHRRTFPHELGHAKFSLEHPDGDGWDEEGLLNEQMSGDFDQYNLMLSGGRTKKPELSFILRPYHWKFIHLNF